MKKFLLLAVTAIMAMGVSAQTAGKWYGGGQVTFGRTTESVSGVKSTQVTVLPEVGYCLTDKWNVGTLLGVQYRKSGGEEKTVFKVSPYLRYTFFDYERVKLFADANVDLGMGRAHGDFAVEYGIGLRPGVEFVVNDRFSLVAHFGFLGYQSGNHAAKANGCKENWGLDFNSNNLMLGFSVHF